MMPHACSMLWSKHSMAARKTALAPEQEMLSIVATCMPTQLGCQGQSLNQDCWRDIRASGAHLQRALFLADRDVPSSFITQCR